LIDLNLDHYASGPEDIRDKKVLMVLGEGVVFFTILIAGLIITRNSIRKEISLIRQQRNFLLSITHELKTPISAIRLCLETLAKHSELDALKRKGLQENALENTFRLNELIDNVLLATRIESGEDVLNTEWVNVSELTRRITRRFSKNTNGVVINVSIQDDVEAKLDPSGFDSILSNLIENAIKYGEQKPINILLKDSGSKIIVEVSDRGMGISKELMEKVFTKFYRVQNEETRSQKGTGLGLYIVKQLVQLHNGSIRVEPNVPNGTRFTVELTKSA